MQSSSAPASPSVWSAAQLDALFANPLPTAPLISATDVKPIVADTDLWDHWPVQMSDGRIAEVAGGSLWIILSAPRGPRPSDRHNVARMRLLWHKGDRWIDCGLLLPDDLNPGAREWSGAARLDPETGAVMCWFTAAGRRGAGGLTFEQRLFHTSGRLDLSGAKPRIIDWTPAIETVACDGQFYAHTAGAPVRPRRIPGFRDPYWFRDPADGQGWLIFTGSGGGSTHADNGVVGLARDNGAGRFELMPPLISGEGLVNEMERPHVVVREGRYYVFWSTQASQFAADGPIGPTGLYGMVAQNFAGPYEPLNGSGLVLANPAGEPAQAYCWQVLETLEVMSFVDHWGLNGRDPATDPVADRAQFGGTIAPILRIEINGNTTRIVA